jgi:hypothetical protein
MRSRWAFLSFLRERTMQVWGRTSGVLRLFLLLVMALLVIASGIVGLLITSFVLLLSLGGMVGHSLGRWRKRPVVRYSTEVEQNQLHLSDELRWLHRELGLRDEEIARLQRQVDTERSDDGS